VGISLYGQWPSELTRVSYLQQNSALLSLSPVLSWKTEVDSLKDIAKGSYVGYGCTFRAPQAMRLAILPVGYAEGYPRLAGENKAHVLLQGSRCQIIGRICMNMMMIDVSHLDNVLPGEEVILIGQDGDEILSGADLGDKSRTIDYEILSRLHPDIPKKILD
jgi:alanine racemase